MTRSRRLTIGDVAMMMMMTTITSLTSNLRQTTHKHVYLVTLINPVFAPVTLTYCIDPMTLTYTLGLGILKIYLHTKNEVSRSRLSKVRARTGQADTHRHTHRD